MIALVKQKYNFENIILKEKYMQILGKNNHPYIFGRKVPYVTNILDIIRKKNCLDFHTIVENENIKQVPQDENKIFMYFIKYFDSIL